MRSTRRDFVEAASRVADLRIIPVRLGNTAGVLPPGAHGRLLGPRLFGRAGIRRCFGMAFGTVR